MKMLVATIEIEAVLLVEDDADADDIQWLARKAMREELRNVMDDDVDVCPMRAVPVGWDDDTLVYHAGSGDITVAKALEMTRVEVPLQGQAGLFE